MKLGEARRTLAQVQEQLDRIAAEIITCPLEQLDGLLEGSNSLLAAESSLKKKIAYTEAESLLEDNTLSDVIQALEVLKKKVCLLQSLTVRQEMSNVKRQRLFEQLYNFRSTRNALELSIEQHSWETELLDE